MKICKYEKMKMFKKGSLIFSSVLTGRVRGAGVVGGELVGVEWLHSVVKSVRSCELVKVGQTR